MAFPGDDTFKTRWLAAGTAIFLLGIYTVFLIGHVGAYAGGSDSSGYLNNAKMLSIGAVRLPERVIAGVDESKLPLFTFLPLGLQGIDNKTMASSYATGIPLLLLAVSRFTGWNLAPPVLAIMFSLLGILVTAWLGRVFGLPSRWAWFAAALLAITPNYINMSLQMMSDVPATVFCTMAIALAWNSRERPAWALAAGAVFAASVLVRITDVIMVVPAAICLGLAWRRWLYFGLGGFPGAVFVCLYNYKAYGNPFETGYGNVEYMFTVKAVPAALGMYAHWFPFVLTPVGLLALGLPFLLRRDPLRVSVLLSWIFMVLAFYAVDAGANHDIWLLRYLLPAFPPILVGGAWVLKETMDTRFIGNMFERMSRFLPRIALNLIIWAPAITCIILIFKYKYEFDFIIRCALVAFCLALAVWLTARVPREKDRGRALLLVVFSQLMLVMVMATFHGSARLGMWMVRPGESAYPKACAWATGHLPANAVIYSMQTSGALLYYTSFTVVRWNALAPASHAEIQRACAASNRPIYAMLFPFEQDEMRQRQIMDRWTQIASVPPITFWRLDSVKAAETP